MTQSELILEYIDGTLDPMAEQQLFEMMADHPELRAELRQFVMIGDAVRADREAYLPPAHVERGLMTALGIESLGSGIEIGGAVAGGGIVGTLAALGSRFWGTVGAFLVGALIAGGGVYLSSLGSDTPVVADKGVTAPTQPNRVQSPVQTTDQGSAAGEQPAGPAFSPSVISPGASLQTPVPVTSQPQQVRALGSRNPGTIARQPRSSGRSIVDLRRDPSAIPTVSENSTERQSSVSISSTPLAISATAVLPVSLVNREDGSSVLPDLRPMPVSLQPASTQQSPEVGEPTLAFELRRNFGGDLTSSNSRETTPSAIEDFSVGGYYHLDDELSVGMEAGRERYAQTLAFADGDTLRIGQRPSYLWGGASLRYRSPAIPATPIHAVGQLTAGLTSAGPLARARLGARIDLLGGVGLTTGFEVSTLFYSFNNQTLSSSRWGFTLGVETDLW